MSIQLETDGYEKRGRYRPGFAHRRVEPGAFHRFKRREIKGFVAR